MVSHNEVVIFFDLVEICEVALLMLDHLFWHHHILYIYSRVVGFIPLVITIMKKGFEMTSDKWQNN